MKNVQELIDQLSAVFSGLRAGTVEVQEADALANVAGKIINASKVQVMYYDLKKQAPNIPFLDATPRVHRPSDEEPKK